MNKYFIELLYIQSHHQLTVYDVRSFSDGRFLVLIINTLGSVKCFISITLEDKCKANLRTRKQKLKAYIVSCHEDFLSLVTRHCNERLFPWTTLRRSLFSMDFSPVITFSVQVAQLHVMPSVTSWPVSPVRNFICLIVCPCLNCPNMDDKKY
jgi:hypothetical protein